MPRLKLHASRQNYYMPNRLVAVLRRFAERRGIAMSEVVRQAVTEYLQRELSQELDRKMSEQ